MADNDQGRFPGGSDQIRTRGRRTKEDPHGLIGQTLDERYYIESVVGIGGMGVVYKGQQEAMDRTVAVKVLMPQMIDDESLIKRFELEARAASRLTHPNTITIYDFGRRGDLLYIVMEYLEGQSLEKALKEDGYLNPQRVARIASQVCASLHEAHLKDIVHRDIKPDNVWLKVVGEQEDFVKVLDFGVAKLRDPKVSDVTMTQAGMIFGTPKYMSPEQAKAKKLDGRSDLYSLGVVMYQALMGRVPFLATDPVSILIQHVHDPPPPFSEIQADHNVPSILEEIVFKSLEKKRENRFANANEMRQALDAYLTSILSASSQGLPVILSGKQEARSPTAGSETPARIPSSGPASYGPGPPPAATPPPVMTPPPQVGPSPAGPQGGIGVDPTSPSVWNMGAEQLSLHGTPATEWVRVDARQSHTGLLATAIILGLLLLGGVGYLIWRIGVPPTAPPVDQDAMVVEHETVDAAVSDEPTQVAILTETDTESSPIPEADASTLLIPEGDVGMAVEGDVGMAVEGDIGIAVEEDVGVAVIEDAAVSSDETILAVAEVVEAPSESDDVVTVALVEDTAGIVGFASPVRVRFEFDRPRRGIELDFGPRRFERDEADDEVWIFDLADGEQLEFEAEARRYRSEDYEEDISHPTDAGEVVISIRLRRERESEEPQRDPCVDPVTGLRDPYCRP